MSQYLTPPSCRLPLAVPLGREGVGHFGGTLGDRTEGAEAPSPFAPQMTQGPDLRGGDLPSWGEEEVVLPVITPFVVITPSV